MGKSKVRTGKLLRDREVFLRDGERVTRIKISIVSQIFAIAMVFGLTSWSGFATAQLLNEREAQMSYAEEMAWHEQIEARQFLLAEMANRLLDEEYDAKLKQLEDLGVADRVDSVGGPYEGDLTADETFAELFKSWKRLDTLDDGVIAVPSAMPVNDARLTSSYGTRRDPFRGRRSNHKGIDLAGPVGTPILSTADGRVVRAGWNSGGYGNLIEIDHGNGITTRYAHLSKVQVKRGDRVLRGEQIGKMGSTGRSTGSHLHYEVRIDGRAVNPIPFMESGDYLLAMQDRTRADEAMEAIGGSE
ncbi:M23 family metallopeptidase [Sphingomicrobium sediminis]|uniref:M23 family metallopeptidase n=1 Tax=Sphingomicrobium sediminis TaxID=2950949 RepID=A0A9X2EI64_9SPHN|nr:M23 family metallopeptidase [Sphingomicrobium sediminis]MCM8558498.1 M23 family metallopeptidase [Sphingomicrobium sediminis]